MSNKRQLTLHFDTEVAAAIEAEAKHRGLNLSRAANDALQRALIDEAGAALADTVKARLDRLDKRDTARARELALIKEIVLLFVRFWFEYAGAPPDDGPDASADADIRFQGFLEMLAEQTG
jgi:post-segregation antitoxin (ccd killing protein)